MLGYNKYGKANVKFLRVVKETPKHLVHEVKAKMQLEGDFNESFETGNNRQVVPTDTMKNSLYIYAKKFNLNCLEEWAIEVGKDMLQRHNQISVVNLELEESNWERIKINGIEHNHAFLKREGIRFATMKMQRNGQIKLNCGIKDLIIMKSTQSGFENYVKDEYTTLVETKDRVFCTKLFVSWEFNVSKPSKIDFNSIYSNNLNLSLQTLAGQDPLKGEYSGSVQQTLFQLGKKILQQNNSIDRVFISLPNVHYFLVHFQRFKTNLTNQNEVFETFDGPHGLIEAVVERNPSSKL